MKRGLTVTTTLSPSRLRREDPSSGGATTELKCTLEEAVRMIATEQRAPSRACPASSSESMRHRSRRSRKLTLSTVAPTSVSNSPKSSAETGTAASYEFATKLQRSGPKSPGGSGLFLRLLTGPVTFTAAQAWARAFAACTVNFMARISGGTYTNANLHNSV